MAYIRQASAADLDLLVELSTRTFLDAYAADNDPFNLEQYVAKAFSKDAIATLLASSQSIILIAYHANTADAPAVGYAHLVEASPVPTLDSAPSPVKLARLYVDQRCIGKGYGSQLMQACLETSTAGGNETIWLNVWVNNPRAQKFYQRWSFQRIGEIPFVLGSEVQTDYVLMRPVILTE